MSGSKKTLFAPWETPKPNLMEKRYVRNGAARAAHPAVKGLSGNAYKVLDYMRIEAAGNRDFQMPHSKYIQWISKPTFLKAVKELEKKGFIDIKENNARIRKPNVYSLSSRWHKDQD